MKIDLLDLSADSRELAEDAAEWLAVLENGSHEDRAVFVAWLKKSPQHVAEILQMLELDAALSDLLPRDPAAASVEPRKYAVQRYLSLNGVRGPDLIPAKDVDRYRRVIIQMFIQRSIDPDSAEDLFQELWLQFLEDSRLERLSDAKKLSGYLHRAAVERAMAFRRGDISWIGGYEEPSGDGGQIHDTSELEGNLGHRRLVGCIRQLLLEAPNSPDRKVLECFFLRPAPFQDVYEHLNLTEIELDQVLWRIRQLFGDIVRERGINLSDPDVQDVHVVRTAAMYVANVIRTDADVRRFERQIVVSPRCATEVDLWRALKRGMARIERMREMIAC